MVWGEDLLQLWHISLNPTWVHRFEMCPLNVILKWVLIGEVWIWCCVAFSWLSLESHLENISCLYKCLCKLTSALDSSKITLNFRAFPFFRQSHKMLDEKVIPGADAYCSPLARRHIFTDATHPLVCFVKEEEQELKVGLLSLVATGMEVQGVLCPPWHRSGVDSHWGKVIPFLNKYVGTCKNYVKYWN